MHEWYVPSGEGKTVDFDWDSATTKSASMAQRSHRSWDLNGWYIDNRFGT
jgi:hypothetical protein